MELNELPRLNEAELELCRTTFEHFDKDKSGTIDVRELHEVFKGFGMSPSDEDIFVMVAKVDQDGSGEIDFQEFVHAIQINKAQSQKSSDESETLDAFVALGGNADKSGHVYAERLQTVIKEFELTLDVGSFIQESDQDGSGTICYDEFRSLLS